MTLTVWKDGTYKVWRDLDATYAADDPEWCTNITLEEIKGEEKKFREVYRE